MNNNHAQNAKIFKAFCDENRLQILELLQNGERCACILLEKLNICQSTLSHHMRILVQSGVVNARNEGKWTYYSISPQGAQHAESLLAKLTNVYSNERDNCDENTK
ncbi:MAG: metalloregulator ArsR/SmtB family transcription factor [Bacillota bacterium]|nr:metalloregulator ArsR/SmtB family transcription factor [Bacillota bacterium]